MSLKQNDTYWEHQQEIKEEEESRGFICPQCGSDEIDEEDELCAECQGSNGDMAYDMYRDLESDCGYPEKFKN